MRAAICLTFAVLLLAAAPAQAVEWTPPELVGEIGGEWFSEADMAGNPSGFRAVVAPSDRGVSVATARDGGRFGRLRHVPGSGDLAEGGAYVEVDQRGNALIAWYYEDHTRGAVDEDRFDEGCCTGARFTVLRRDGTFEPTRTLAPRGRDAGIWSMRIDAGRVGIAYRETADFHGDGSARRGLLVRTHSPSGRKRRVDEVAGADGAYNISGLSFVGGRPRLIYRRSLNDPVLVESEANASYEFSEAGVVVHDSAPLIGPRIATGAGGHQAIAWTLDRENFLDEDERVFAGTRRPGQPFDVREVGRAASGVNSPGVAVARDGDAVATWAGSGRRFTVLGAGSLGGGPFGAVRTFETGIRQTQPETLADVNSSGTGIVTWERDDDDAIRVGFLTRAGRVRGVQTVGDRQDAEPISVDPPEGAIDDRGRAVVLYVAGNRLMARRALAPRG